MSDMFGAPIGQSAAEADTRANVLAGVQAQKILGEIAMQPAERVAKEAQAKLLTAEAEQKQAAIDAQQQLNTLNQNFQIAKQQAVATIKDKASQGAVATINDLAMPGAQPKSSQASQLQQFVDYAEQRGTSETVLLPYRKELSTLLKDEAIANHDNAMASGEKLTAIKKQAELVSSWAGAALANPSQYSQMLMSAAQAGYPTDVLPKTFNAKLLETIRVRGIDAAKQAELKLKAAEDGSQAALRNAEISRAQASTGLAQARMGLETEKLALLKKYGGDNAEATLEQKRVTTAAKTEAAAAKDAKDFPAMPLDPKSAMFQPGKTFTDRQGRKLTFVGRDEAGLPTFELAGKAKAKEIMNEPAQPGEED